MNVEIHRRGLDTITYNSVIRANIDGIMYCISFQVGGRTIVHSYPIGSLDHVVEVH